jgi:integrase
MNGHVRQRGATWAFVVDLGGQRAQRCIDCNTRRWVEREGLIRTCGTCGGEMTRPRAERRQVWRSGFKTKSAAQKAMRAMLGAVDAGRDPLPADICLRDWVDAWMASSRASKLRPHTVARYRTVFDRHLLPDLGAMRLSAIRPRHLRSVLDAMAGKGLSPRVQTEARNIASVVFRAAVEDDLMETNPATAVRARTGRRRELVVPDTDGLSKLVRSAEGTLWATPIALAAHLGMRRGEVLAVQWSDIDLDAGILRVCRGLHRLRDANGDQTTLAFLDVKTENSKRQLELGANLVKRLRRHKVVQAERRAFLGAAWIGPDGRDDDLVCDRGDGGPIDPDAFTHAFKRIAKKAGLPAATRLHDVRHAVATAMLANGVETKLASAVLGHSSAAFTADQYMHVLRGMTRSATDAIDKAIGS